jgi:hypothetical protein
MTASCHQDRNTGAKSRITKGVFCMRADFGEEKRLYEYAYGLQLIPSVYGCIRSVGFCSLLASMTLFCSLTAAQPQTQPSDHPRISLSDRFLREAPAAWERVQQSLAETSFSGSTTNTMNSSDPSWTAGQSDTYSYRKSVEQFWQIPGAQKVDSVGYDRHGNETARNIDGRNRDYAFMLSRVGNPGPFVIYAYGTDKQTFDSVQRYIDFSIIEPLLKPFRACMPEVPLLSEVVRRTGFRLGNCRYIYQDSHQLAEIEFSYPPSAHRAGTDPSTIETTAVFDPDADWRVVTMDERSATEIDNEDIHYTPGQPHLGGAFNLRTHGVYVQGRHKGKMVDRVMQFQPLTFGLTPLSAYYLASYGIPEIPTQAQRAFTRLMWIGLSILVFGILIYVYQRRAKRGESTGGGLGMSGLGRPT